MANRKTSLFWLMLGSAALGCNSGKEADTAEARPDQYAEPGKPVDVAVNGAALAIVEDALEGVEEWDRERLLSEYETAFQPAAQVEPSSLLNYDLLQASALALRPEEEQVLRANGFVIARDQRLATFSYGYREVYGADLPVFVSADSVLDAVHRSFDDILFDLEVTLLVPTLKDFLLGVRSNLAESDAPDAVRKDVDFFLAVPESLLSGSLASPGFAGSFEAAELAEFVEAATNAQGILNKELFGADRQIDFSQFEPRGHYTRTEEMKRYFQAMMWLGRTDLRFIETLGDGERVLRPNQVRIAFELRDLMGAKQREQWDLIDSVVGAFVGEHDYMALPELDALQADLELASAADLGSVPDETLAQAIIDGQYGEQRIASQVIQSAIFEELPLSASFALFGQRYVVDSHVFSQVTFSRAPRPVPDPLDAAFAAFGNNHAASLLASELERWPYAPKLAGIRKLVDLQPETAWQNSLYTLWLGALRSLSAGALPTGVAAAPDAEEPGSGLPAVAQTEPWARRLLNTQLGSWSQLRHDTLLYAKQSYTDGSECEFPDAYVDPYPEFWANLLQYAEHGRVLLEELPANSQVLTRAASYFERFAGIVSVLQRMSEHQLSGMPHTAEDLAFINDAVRISGGGSGPPTSEGWYHQLLYKPEKFGDVDNVVADVHTDVGGDTPPREASVLHVGTSYPRLMVTAIDTCEGPRVYVGPVYAFHQYLASGITRLNDEEWQTMVTSDAPPVEVPWMESLLGPE